MFSLESDNIILLSVHRWYPSSSCRFTNAAILLKRAAPALLEMPCIERNIRTASPSCQRTQCYSISTAPTCRKTIQKHAGIPFIESPKSTRKKTGKVVPTTKLYSWHSTPSLQNTKVHLIRKKLPRQSNALCTVRIQLVLSESISYRWKTLACPVPARKPSRLATSIDECPSIQRPTLRARSNDLFCQRPPHCNRSRAISAVHD